MITIDWSHTKGLVTYDGKKVSVVDRELLLKKLAGESIDILKSKDKVNPASLGVEEESIADVQSIITFNPSASPEFRPIYDRCKEDIAQRYPNYTKKHIHNAALNRTATFLAKKIFNMC